MKILIADDHTVVREGFSILLERLENVARVFQVGNGRDAVRVVNDEHPEIVILDILMPELSGVSAAAVIAEQSPESSLIALSANFSPEMIESFLEVGGRGILFKTCSFDELKRAIEVVGQGGIYISPEARDFVRRKKTTGNTVSKKLSGREQEILRMISEGRSVSEIATLLNLSSKTVETYKRRLMDKLGLFTVAELTKYALRRGLTSLSN